MKELLDREERQFMSLKGKKKHYCWDWDGMAIDETYPEFESCTCFETTEVLIINEGSTD